MLELKIPVVVLSILFAMIGMYIALRINNVRKKIDTSTLRARVFLNESFLDECGKLLLIAMILFIIRAFLELEELFETVLEYENTETIDEIIVLGILICLILLLSKWLKLMDPLIKDNT